MATQTLPNVSPDLVWEVTRSNNAFLVKRNSAGGVQFSRDPLNLTNVHTRKHAGYVNEKAVGVNATKEGGVELTTKKAKQQSRPAAHGNVVHFHGRKSGPKVYRTIVNHTATQGYRPDLREAAVARASRIRQTASTKKPQPNQKLRGSKAQK